MNASYITIPPPRKFAKGVICLCAALIAVAYGSSSDSFPPLQASAGPGSIMNIATQAANGVYTVVSSTPASNGGVFLEPTTCLRYFVGNSNAIHLAVCMAEQQGVGASLYGVEFLMELGTPQDRADLHQLAAIKRSYEMLPTAPPYLTSLMKTLCHMSKDELRSRSGGAGPRLVRGLAFGSWKNQCLLIPHDPGVQDHPNPGSAVPQHYDVMIFAAPESRRFDDVSIDPALLRKGETGKYGIEELMGVMISKVAADEKLLAAGTRGLLVEESGGTRLHIVNSMGVSGAPMTQARDWAPYLKRASPDPAISPPAPQELWRMGVMSEHAWRALARLRISPEIGVATADNSLFLSR